MANNSIKYSVGFNVDKSGLNQLKASLMEIKKITKEDLMQINSSDIQKAEKDLQNLQRSIKEIETAFEKAFNTNLGTLNVSKFNAELKNMNLSKIHQDLSKAGVAGQNAFRNMTTQVLTTNMQLKQTHSLLDNMATTMANTVKWGVTSSIFNNITGSVQQAYGYVKSLDSSLNDIRIVTGKSAEEMDKFAVKANNAAKALGKSTTDYTKASLIYYQQGLSEQDVNARAETTLKAANVTGQSTDAVSEQLTAVWNGYKVSAEEAELYIDKLAAVAATTASDLEELSTGMSKVASAAATMGVDVDQLNAQLATIVSVTRQAPESVGTALKTIYARMSDLKLGEKDEDGLGLGDVSGQMEAMGIEVLDGAGNLRDMGEVIEEVAGKWDTWTEAQKTAMAQVMAGKRQYNNLMALFENWDMYEDALLTSADAAGTLQKQQDIYMESTAAHLEQLKAASEDLYDSLLNPEGINPIIDGLTAITNLTSNFVDSIGGGGNVLLALGSIGSKIFSQHLASGISTFIVNMQSAKENANQLRAELAILNQYETANINDGQVQELIGMKRQILDLDKAITIEERNIGNEYIQQKNALFEQQNELENRIKNAEEVYARVSGDNIDLSTKESRQSFVGNQGAIDTEIAALESLEGGIRETDAAYQELQQSIRNNTQVSAEALEVIENQIDAADDFAKLNQANAKDQKALNDALDNYVKIVGDKNNFDKNNRKHLEASRQVQVAYKNAVLNTTAEVKKVKQEIQSYDSTLKNNQSNVESLTQSWGNFIKQIDLRQKIQNTIQLASSFGQLASAVSSLTNLGDIWSNEDLTNGEKLLQTVTNLGFALPMLANSFTQVGKALGITTAFSSAASAAQNEYATIIARRVGQERLLNIATAQGISLETASQMVALKSQMTETQRIAIRKILIALKKKEMTAEAADIAIKEILIATNGKVAFSFTAAATSVKAFFASLGPIGWATLVIGALAGVATAVTAAIDKMTLSAEEASEAIAESAEKYKSLENELGSLEGELSTTKDRLLELLAIADERQLSLTEKDELTRLQAESIELENQIELLKQKMELENRKTVRTAMEAYNQDSYSTNKIDNSPFSTYTYDGYESYEDPNKTQTYSDKGTVRKKLSTEDFEIQAGGIKLDDTSTFETWKKSMEELQQEALDNAANATAGSKDELEWQEVADAIAADIERKESAYEEKRLSYLDTLGENYEAAMDALPALKAQNESGVYDDVIKYYEGISYEYQKQLGSFDASVNKVVDALSLDESQLTKLQTTDGLLDHENKEVNEDAIVDIIGKDNFEQLKVYADSLNVSMYDVLNHYQDMSGLLGLSSEEIEKKLEEIKNTEIKDIVDKTNKDFQDKGITKTLDSNAITRAGITTEDLQNWDQIIAYIDEATLENEGWAEALKQAKSTYEEIYAIQKAEEELKSAAEKYDLDLEELKAYKDLLVEENEELAKTPEALNQVAIANKRMAKGTGELASNWDKFNEIMSDSDASLEDVSEILPDINSALQDVLNLDTEEFELLPKDFAKDNWDLINDVTNGVEGAVDELRHIAGQEILMDIDATLDADGSLQTDFENLHNSIAEYMGTEDLQFQVGVALDPTQHAAFIDNCNSIIQAAGMTAQQAEAYFASMGYDVKLKEVKPESTDTSEYSYYELDEAATEKAGGVPQFKKEPTKITVSSTSGATAYAIETITPNGSYGGGTGVETTAPKSTSTKKAASGGGSKSKPKSKDKKDNDDIDKYHEVNTQIEKYNKELSKLQKQQDKLVGPDLINNLNQQLEILEKQKAAQQAKLQIALAEAQVLRATLAAQGAAFNADGTIANFTAILQAKLDYVNMLIQQYNAMTAAEQEAFESTIEQAQKDYETLKSQMEQYDTLISSTIPDIEASIQDIVDQEIEIQIQKFNLRMEIVLDVAEAEREFNEFKRRIIDGIKDDDIVGVAKARLKDFSSYYKEDGTGSIQEGTKHVNDIMRELEIMNKGGTSSVYGDDRARALEDLQKYYQQLMEDLEAVQDMVEEIEESYIEMIEKADEEFQKQIELYEHITSLIEHDMNVIKLVYGDSSYDKLIEYYDKQTENNLNQLDFLKLEKQFWEEQMAAEEEGSEAWQAAKEQWLDATNSLNDAIASSIENLQAKYSNAISAIFDNLNNKITGGKGLDYINEEWTLINKNADMYLDKVNSMYEIQKLENKLQESIDNTTSLYAQEKLNELLDDELAKLREKDKLTQYEVDRANMLYEIALKEIALEEAQQNKSQMKLRRDSQGNYSYQYVADSDKVGAAEQELQDAQNSLYNLDKDAYQQNLDEMLALWTEFQEKMAEAAMINDPQLRAERELLIKEQYGEMINSLAEQNEFIRLNLQDSTFTELANMYNLDVQNFQVMSDEEQAILMEQMVPGWTSAVQEMTEAFAGEEGFYGLCREAFNELDIATQEYEDDLRELQDTAGVTFDDLASGLDENIEKTQELIRNNEELINEYREELNAIRAVIAEMNSLIASYKAAEAAAKAATQAAYELWRATQLANGGSGGGGDSGGSGGNPGGGPGSGGGPDGVLQVGDTVTYNGGLYYEDSYGGGKTGSRGAGGKVQVTDIKTDGRPYPIHVSSSNSAFGWLKQSQLSGYDTGGYTGEWANGSTHGRIALLHQKELVLNEHDTANMLAAVNIVRDIGSLLGRITGSLTGEMFNMFASSTMGPSSGMTGSSGIEQKVQIDATFPNVTSSSEIENALRNLVNVASQYASTNKR